MQDNDSQAKMAFKKFYDKKAKQKKFSIDDPVLVYYPSATPGANQKFYRPWRGVFYIIQQDSPTTYLVKKPGGKKQKIHQNRIRHYDPLNDPNDSDTRLSTSDEADGDIDSHLDTNDESLLQNSSAILASLPENYVLPWINGTVHLQPRLSNFLWPT